jgi:hypothetical protein
VTRSAVSAACLLSSVIALATWALPALAAPVKLDDTGTQLSPPNLRMAWRDVAAGSRQMQAQARLLVRLDTRAHAGRQARIYLVMPQDVGGALVMHWQARGPLMPGSISPGERVLVFQGRIPGPVIEDQWSLLLVADGAWMSESRRLECSFDIEWD